MAYAHAWHRVLYRQDVDRGKSASEKCIMDKKVSALEKFTHDERLSANERRIIERMTPFEKFVLNARFVRDDERRECHRTYIADMIAFQSHPPAVPSVAQVCALVPDALARHGFSHSYQIDQNDKATTVTCQVTHRMGHSESTSMSIPTDEVDNSRTVAYLQGITLLALCGLVAENELA